MTALRVLVVGLGGVTRTFRHWPERVLARALVERGHRVRAIGTRDRRRAALRTPHEWIDGVEVWRVPPRYAPNRRLRRALQAGTRPDIIHLMHPRNVLAAQVTAWAQREGIPTVYTWLGPFHDAYLTPDRERPFEHAPTIDRLLFTRPALWAAIARNPAPRAVRDSVRNYRLHAPLWNATALLPCSQFEAAMLRRFGLRQPQQVVPLWLDRASIAATAAAPPPPAIAALPRPWLLFVGQLTPRKGYDTLIAALPHIVAQLPTARVIIVSGLNEAQRAALLAQAQQAGVAQHIHLAGYLSDRDLINLYRAADALLFPTRYEGFGLPLLEAMAADCPVISTDIPVVNEIVQHGENGLLVPYNDAAALARAAVLLCQQPALRAHLCAGGRTTLHTRYNEAVLIEQVITMYRAVLARVGEPPL